jgi:hypothetical protein
MSARRTALGRGTGFGFRTYSFLTADAVEMDEVDGFNVVRSRVLLDDVLLITLHKRPPYGRVLAMLFLLLFTVLGIALLREGGRVLVMLVPVLLPLLLLVVASLFLGVTYVDVLGRRSRARMAWSWRARRAREVFELLVARAEERQGSERPSPASTAAAQGGKATDVSG